MKKRIVVFAIIVLLAFVGCNSRGKNQSDTSEEKDIVKIGAILPLTGDAAIYGQSMRNGLQLAFDESILKNSIQLLLEDDMGKNLQATNAGQLLVDKHVNAIIGGAQSKTADVLIPMITKNEIPLISPGASSVDFDKISPFFFRLWPSDSYDGKIMADLIIKKLDIRDIAVFYTNSKYGEGIKRVFEDIVKNNNGNIVFSEPFTEGAKDFRTQILKIKQSGAKGVFIPGYFAEVSIILKQIKELNIDIKILGTSSFHDDKLLDCLGESMEGVIFSYPEFDIESENSVVKEFSEKYVSRYKVKPDIWAALTYDCFKVVEKTLINGAKSPKEIRNALLNIRDFPGAGGTFSFDENGNVIKSYSILTVINGKIIKYK
ncbi:MAG: hypothetical protein FJ264_15545 [Planctomycetes bacterium]|nr:hypothetical protein [Planctomycetota bacterium]